MKNYTAFEKYLIETRKTNASTFLAFFGERLKRLRTEKGWSQKKIAKEIGVPVSTYGNWELGRREPGIYDIYCLLWAFKIDPETLFPEEFDQ